MLQSIQQKALPHSGQSDVSEMPEAEELKQQLCGLFEPASIHYIRQELWLWIKAASNETVYLHEGNPSAVLFLENLFKRMIRYAWQLQKEAESLKEAETFPLMSQERIRQDRQQMIDLDELTKQYRGTIRRLTKKETQQPLLFVQRFFRHQPKKEWFKMLERWAEYSLSNCSIQETGNELDLEAYELLDGLLEAVYLLHFRDQPNQEHLDPVVRLIIEALAPEMIFEVRHSGCTDTNDPYTDLLIIIPESRQKSLAELDPILELVTMSDRRLTCSLHTSGYMREMLKTGHIYFSLVCVQPNLIYSNGLKPLPDPPAGFDMILKKASTTFETGYQKASSFYEGARQQQERPLAAFMLQQAAELTFRTMALSFYGYEKKTHSFKSLKQINRRVAPALNDVFPADTPEEKRLLQLLEDAYIHGRYADDYHVSEADLEKLKQRVGLLLSMSREIFSDRVASLTNHQNHEKS